MAKAKGKGKKATVAKPRPGRVVPAVTEYMFEKVPFLHEADLEAWQFFLADYQMGRRIEMETHFAFVQRLIDERLAIEAMVARTEAWVATINEVLHDAKALVDECVVVHGRLQSADQATPMLVYHGQIVSLGEEISKLEGLFDTHEAVAEPWNE